MILHIGAGGQGAVCAGACPSIANADSAIHFNAVAGRRSRGIDERYM